MLSITISHELSTVVEAKDIEAKDANGMLLVLFTPMKSFYFYTPIPHTVPRLLVDNLLMSMTQNSSFSL